MCSALARCKIELVYRSTAAEEEIQMRASSAPAAGAGATAPAGAFPTIQSHGARVARSHAYDWLALLLLAALEALLNAIEPFHRYVGSGMMADLGYPMKSNTVPVWGVPIVAVIGPVIIFTVVYFRRRNVYDLHHATLGILFSVLITGVLTDAIKNAVGRPRPNFFWRCFPDGIAVYDKITKEAICHGDASLVKEGHKSFPSGHASWSFAGLGFLSWYLAGKITVFDRRGHVAKLCVVLLPLLLAAMISISRVDDYWHHWQDVCTGGILGIVVASVCYLQFFPPPSDERGFWPHAHFRHISESAREGASQARRAAEMSNAGSTDVIAWQGQTGANTIRSLVAMEAGEEADDSTPAFMGVDPSIGDATGIVLLTNHVQSPVEPSKADAVEL